VGRKEEKIRIELPDPDELLSYCYRKAKSKGVEGWDLLKAIYECAKEKERQKEEKAEQLKEEEE